MTDRKNFEAKYGAIYKSELKYSDCIPEVNN